MEPYTSDLGTIRFTHCTRRTVPCFGNSKPTASSRQARRSARMEGYTSVPRIRSFTLLRTMVPWLGNILPGNPFHPPPPLGRMGPSISEMKTVPFMPSIPMAPTNGPLKSKKRRTRTDPFCPPRPSIYRATSTLVPETDTAIPFPITTATPP